MRLWKEGKCFAGGKEKLIFGPGRNDSTCMRIITQENTKDRGDYLLRFMQFCIKFKN